MSNGDQLSNELLDVGKAIGLLDGSGNLQTSWFQDPLSNIENVLQAPAQRAALLNVLGDFLTPEQLPDIPAGEIWYQLLGSQPRGNAYLTVANNGSTTFGFAGEFHSTDGPPPFASFSAHLPLVNFNGSSVTAVAGTSAGPLDISLRLHLGWKFGTDPLGLDSVIITASLAPLPTASATANFTVALEQLQLDSSGPQNVVLDPSNLGSEAVQLIVGFIHEQLSRIAGPTGEVASIVNHLLPLLGFGDAAIPQFPFGQLGDPNAINTWFSSLLNGSAASAWLGHLAGLIGSTATAVSGSGTPSDPWTVQLLPIGTVAGSGVNLTLAQQTVSSTTWALIGLQAVIIPSGATPPVRLVANATLASIPIVGTGSASILPSASITATAPGTTGTGLVSTASITVGSLNAGFSWNGTTLQPLLEMDAVTLLGTSYDRIDLTNADSVEAAASAAVRTAIANLLGSTGPGVHLAALAGIVAPANDPSSPHLIDPAALVANPARAIAAVHRAVLLDPAHNWSHMLEELAAIAGLTGAVSGTGTRSDPWVIGLTAAAGVIDVELAAWNDQSSGVATDPQELRIGLRAAVSQPPLTFWWLCELLAFDLPQSGAGTVSLMAGQDAHFEIQPVPSIPDVGGLSISIADFSADMTWAPGSSITWSAGVDNLRVSFAGSSVTVASLKFPAAAALDVTSPGTFATQLGIGVADLELLVRLLLARAANSWGGTAGFVLAGLLGVHNGLPGLPVGWPVLADPGAAGTLFSNPFAALRTWLAQIATGVGSDGTPLLPVALPWLRAMLSNALPVSLSSVPSFALPISGSGTYDDPWALPLTTAASVDTDAMVWLEPAGPPPVWAAPLENAATSAPDFPTLMQVAQSVGAFLPVLSDALLNTDPASLAAALGTLSSYFSTSDGVVPLVSQIPTGGAWTAGTTLSSAHPTQPSDPAAISQILTQIDTWAGGAASPRTVLLLGPAFSDHNIWQTLLASPSLHGTVASATNFNLRVPGLDPSAVDLTGVTAVASYYTADLDDDGSGNLAVLTAQIGRVVARIQQLNGATSVILVGHSTAGVAARAFTSANATLVEGLITLGSPHTGSPLPFLSDSGIADAIRALQVFRSAVPADPMRDAFDHMVQALDGYLPLASPAALPVASPYPVGSFADPGSVDTGGKPALALGSQLGGSLLALLQTTVSALANTAANPTTAPPAPTHIAFGVRGHLDFPGTAGQIAVDATIRGDVFRVALASGAADPPHPAHALAVRARLSNPNGWLVGQSSTAAGNVRVQWAELGVDILPNGSGGVQVNPILEMYQVSYNGPVLPSANWTSVNAQALLGAVFQSISNPAPASTTALSQLLTALTNLGVAVADPHGGIGVSADAFAAILVDAAGYLGPKLATALAGGLPGFSGPSAGPWTSTLGALPLELYISANPWTAGIRTITAGGAVFPLAPNAWLTFDASVAFPAFQPVLDASFNIGAFSLTWSSANAQLIAQALPWLPAITLVPAASPATLQSALDNALPRLLFSAAGSAILEAILGPGFSIGPLDSFFSSTSSSLTQPSALGNSGGTGLDSSRLTQLLQAINQAAGFPAGPGLSLPGGLQLTASGAGTSASPVSLSLATTAPIGGVVGITAGVSFDGLMHPSPSGTITLTIPLPAGWNSVAVTFGASTAGVTLVVTPGTAPPIQILPTFSGLGALAGAAEALLPQALDALVTALGPSTILTLTLDVTAALGIYDTVGGFAAHANDLKALLQTNWLAGFPPAQRAAAANAIAAVFSGTSPLAGVLPGTVTASSGTVQWSLPVGGGNLAVSLGWDATGPTALLGLNSIKLASGALGVEATAGYANGNFEVSAGLSLNLQQTLGIDLTPTLAVSENGTAFQVQFYPLAKGAVNGVIEIDFIPPAFHVGTGGAAQLIDQWLIPLVGNTLFTAIQSRLSQTLWTGGPTLQSVLIGAQIAQSSGGGVVLNPSLPDITAIVTGLVSTLATGVSLPLTSTLNLALANDAGRLGVRIYGEQDFDVGDFSLGLLFGAPSDWGAGFDTGAAVYIFDVGSGPTFTFNPGILVAGLGLGLTGQNDAPLVNTSGFRLGGVRLYSFFHGEFGNGFAFDSPGGGVELDSLGIPLGQATGPNVGGNNPVAASLLQSNGSDNNAGDTQPVNPGVDVAAWYWDAPQGDATFHILFQDSNAPIWIGVHSQFGPIYIDQIGLIPNGTTSVSLVLDASVKIDGLTGEVDELGVTIPLKSLTSPGDWTLDLKGIALSFSTPGVTIAGALLKNDSGPAIEYDGMLLVEITQFGIVAVGAYSKPTDAQGSYTSIFIFAGVFIVIGIPPVIEIDAIGLGVGYNRELIVPTDINQIPNFILVAALDDGGALANDPMGELTKIGTNMPAKRGSFWLAVGLHGTTFVIVHVTAVVYVALDTGVEIGVLGVARMAIPTDDTALVSVELALKARYSSAEGTLSIQAQLTDNSYIFAPDCQLTGGFAYFMWFPQGQFVLTLGGYNPNFQVPTQFPNVPRLGFYWGLPIGPTIKGGCYFALTNTCVMAGGSLNLTYGISCANIWFTAYADFLISWDPFYYNIGIGISVGASVSIRICFFGCVNIGISISIGATLTIVGPPLHGSVSVNLDVCSVTIPFGPDPNPQPNYITDWGTFATKYLYGGDRNGSAFAVHVLTGLAPPEPSGGQPAPGTQAAPWKLTSEFSFQCDTNMPATISTDFVFGDQDESADVHAIDIAPMNKEAVGSHLVVTLLALDGSTWTPVTTTSADPRFLVDKQHWTTTPTIGKVSEATWHWIDPANIPAAANTLPAVTSLFLEGLAVTEGQSQLIPIAHLQDYGNSRPLPFAVPWNIGILKSYGVDAAALAMLAAGTSTSATLSAAQQMLSGGGFFSTMRVNANLPAAGLPPLAVRALTTYRSAPPLLTPITTGLTMNPPGLPNPPVVATVPVVLPVAMQNPRLRAVLQGRPQPVSDAPAPILTSVKKVAAAGVLRMAPPRADAVGASLRIVAAPTATRPTATARAPRTLRSPELGWTSGSAHQQQWNAAAQNLASNGVEVPAGATHLWDVPVGTASELVVRGAAAYRVTFLTRGGSVIGDREYPTADGSAIPIPASCGMFAITCLGGSPAASPAPGFGSVSAVAAPAGAMAATGWQAENLLPQVGPTTILARGAALVLAQFQTPRRSRQAVSQTMVRVSEAIASQSGASTWLPTSTGVVMILLDQQDPAAAADGDLSLAIDGATLSSSPIRVLGGRRRALLYDVTAVTAGADHISVAAASVTGWRFAGVVGLAGNAQEWGVRFNGTIPQQIVPDGPLTPDGSVTVRLLPLSGGPA
jgi:hypothetical protein